MIKLNKVVLGFAAAAALVATGAQAQTINMQVKAEVQGTCKMVAANALDFGLLDPVAAPLVPGATTIQYLCTKGKAPSKLTIDADADGNYSGNMVHATVTADKIPFTLKWTTPLAVGTGMASGNEVTVDVIGEIAGGVYQNLTAGIYSVTLPVILTP